MRYLIGAGGWAYFQVPNKTPLKAYSEVFNFVEVNSTFYEYPTLSTVEGWRRMVPADFTFAVRCHQDLTHRFGLKPTEEALAVFNKAKNYCEILRSPFMVLETPASHSFNQTDLTAARDFFSSITTDGLRVVWEYRAPFTPEVNRLMQDFNIIQSVDLSIQKSPLDSEVVYSRVFGKGKHNLYQFTDNELIEIEQNAATPQVKQIAVSFHGARMYNDAARSQRHLATGKFMPVTNFFGVDSAKAVLAEDTKFPANKTQLIADQGWKVIDLSEDKRVHLSDVLEQIPEGTYRNLNDLTTALEGVI
ncbi:MAG TPA: DUF72 domain-containing protein [Candidatus Acidoferrales bacterium]|nr:DUF72 domain-containing protein [Candidatus Acidoferrales bacterium]